MKIYARRNCHRYGFEGLNNQSERVTIDYIADKNYFKFIRYICTICRSIAVSPFRFGIEKFVERHIREVLQ